MLGNNFVVKFITSRNCFLMLSEANVRKLSFQKAVKLTFDSKDLYCSCVTGSEINENSYVGIPSLYAKALGIVEHQSVYITDVVRLPNLGKIVISPVSNDDYEILELSSESVQSSLLDQIRVINLNQKLTIWISKWLHVTVKIDDSEPMSFGYLANLTEVHILPPQKSKPVQKEMYTPCESSSESESSEASSDEDVEHEDCNELLKLKKYLSIKKPIVYRVSPLKTSPNLTENDTMVTHPYNVFIYKQNVPKFLNSDSRKEVMLCKISKIGPPADYRDTKDENTTFRNDIIVRVCILEDYYNSFSDDTKSRFSDNLISDKHPTIFIPEKTMLFFDLKTGSKLLLGNSFDFQSDVRSVEVTTTDRRLKNVVQKLKTFLAEHVKYSKCILNAGICTEIEDNVIISLKFNPPSEFCIFDDFVLRCCKIYQNVDKHVEFQKPEADKLLVNLADVCPDICDFKNIVQQAESLLSMKNRNENILIVGKSGSGKSTISKVLAKKLSDKPYFCNIVFISCKKYKGKTVESLHKIFSQDFQNMIYYQPSLLVLDDLHIICSRTESGGETQTQDSLYNNRVAEMLSELIENYQKTNKISVIATTDSTLKLNENVLSSRGKHLFRNVFRITELDKKHRDLVMRELFDKQVTVENNVDYDDLSVKTEGYVVQDLVDFVNKSVFESLKRNVSQTNDKKPVVTLPDIEAALANSVALALRDVQLHSPGQKDFKDVGGLESVKKMLVESMNWPAQYPDLFNNAPLRLQSGILLYGPPGVGKTLLVGAAARQCGLRLIAVKGPELLSKYIGASEQAVRGIFEKAQSARPCILFFDEFDSLAPRRGHDSTGVTDRVVNQLLTQLDGVEGLHGVFVVAATSRPDLLDPALLRPGRLDRQVLCPVPDQTSRLSILKALSRNLHLAEEVDLKKIAVATKGFSGADLQAVLYTAQLYAVEDALRTGNVIDDIGVIVTNLHMDDSLKGASASLSKHEAFKYDQIYSKFQGKKDEADATIKKQKATLA